MNAHSSLVSLPVAWRSKEACASCGIFRASLRGPECYTSQRARGTELLWPVKVVRSYDSKAQEVELQNVFNTSEDARRKSDLSMAAHLPSFDAEISWNLAFSRSVKAEWRRRLVSRIKHEMVSICRCQRVLYCAVGAMRTMLKDNQCIAWLNDKK